MARLNRKMSVKSSMKFLGMILFMIAFSASARGVYQTDQAFLSEVYNNDIPKSKVVWNKGDVRQTITRILGHDYAGLRIRYWQKDQRSSWILEEIGKEQPITFGIVVNDGQVEQVKVLAFRESRGDEIRYPAFTQQFKQLTLVDKQLDGQIDGISGATMSVRAMTVMVTLALYLAEITATE
jgi:hypothetical protein